MFWLKTIVMNSIYRKDDAEQSARLVWVAHNMSSETTNWIVTFCKMSKQPEGVQYDVRKRIQDSFGKRK